MGHLSGNVPGVEPTPEDRRDFPGDEDPLDLADTPAEVDAVFRTQRRIAFGYGGVFLGLTLAVPVLTQALGWWSEGRLLGGMSPNFVMAAVGLYGVFLTVALAAARLAGAVEDRMLGDPTQHRVDDDGPPP